MSSDFHNFWHTYTVGNFEKNVYIINPSNFFCVTALPCKILIAILVVFFTALLKRQFYSGITFVCTTATMCCASLCTHTQDGSNVDSRDIRINWWSGVDLWPLNRTAFRTSAVTGLLCYFTYLHESNLKLRFLHLPCTNIVHV